MGFSIALLLLLIPLSETALAGTGSLIAGVCGIRVSSGVYGQIYRLFIHNAFLFDTGCLPFWSNGL